MFPSYCTKLLPMKNSSVNNNNYFNLIIYNTDEKFVDKLELNEHFFYFYHKFIFLYYRQIIRRYLKNWIDRYC